MLGWCVNNYLKSKGVVYSFWPFYSEEIIYFTSINFPEFREQTPKKVKSKCSYYLELIELNFKDCIVGGGLKYYRENRVKNGSLYFIIRELSL